MKTFKELYEACCAACEKRADIEEVKEPTGDLKKACWKGYTAVGMKMKNGRKVPNCVPTNEEVEQIDEISRKKAREYGDAAHEQESDIRHTLKSTEKSKHLSPSTRDELKKLADRRKAGIKLAADKRGYYKGSDAKYNFTHGDAKVHATEEVELDEAAPHGMSDREYARHELGKAKKPEVKVGAKVSVTGGGSGVVQKIYDKELHNGQKRKFIHLKDRQGRDFHHRYYASRVRVLEEVEQTDEQAPVAPTLDRKYLKGTPEHKAYKASKVRQKFRLVYKDGKLSVKEETDRNQRLRDALAKVEKDFTKSHADQTSSSKAPTQSAPKPKTGGGMPYYPDSNGGKRYMGDSVEMDGEQIDELSKDTLASYNRKAWDDRQANQHKTAELSKKPLLYKGKTYTKDERDDAEKTHRELQKLAHRHGTRTKGIETSEKKWMAKEEVEQVDESIVKEAVYQGKKVPLNKPMAGDVKKSKVYVDPDGDGTAQKVNFGDKNMTIKKNIPARRKSFRARHNCENPGPKTKARYWSCKAW